MTDRDAVRLALGALAELLDYPVGDPRPPLARALERVNARTARALDRFAAWALRTPAPEREEHYTATFDLSPDCPPHVGHHLCGEHPTRGAFLARLAGVYAAHGFAAAPDELPDHLSTVLRFVAAAHGRDRDALVDDGLVPAVAKMRAALRGRASPYRHLLAGLERLLEEERAVRLGEAPRPEEATP